MDEKKAKKLEQLEAEMARLWEQSQNETDIKKKQKLIAERNTLQRKAVTLRYNRKISRQTKEDLVAYSFIAPNFVRSAYPKQYVFSFKNMLYYKTFFFVCQ